jgi:hypothetical protein
MLTLAQVKVKTVWQLQWDIYLKSEGHYVPKQKTHPSFCFVADELSDKWMVLTIIVLFVLFLGHGTCPGYLVHFPFVGFIHQNYPENKSYHSN